MVNVNIEKLLKKENRSKYWLCQKINITSRNLNRIIRGETTSISFKYIEEFCLYLNCNPGELFTIEKPSLVKTRFYILENSSMIFKNSSLVLVWNNFIL